ncbi:uncharacterized protein ACR2FA_002025 [Aphomia sociella]
MAEERSIQFNLLEKDELIYEILIRGAQPVDGGVTALRAQVRTLNKEIPTDEILECPYDKTLELITIKSKLDSLVKLFSCISSNSSLKSLNRVQCLAHHIYHRLDRLILMDTEDTQFGVLRERLDSILIELDCMVHRFKISVTPTSVNSTHVPTVDTISSDSYAAVYKLNCCFNGKTCVKVFLQRLDELCLSRGISEMRLFNSAAEIFTEEALYWYRSIRSEANSWAELRSLLLEDYLPPDYDYRLLQEIRSRTQGADESIVNYLSIMQNYFSRLSQPLPNQEKLNIVLFNIRPFYTSQLALTPIESWSELKRQCRLLERARERSGNFTEPPRVTSTYLAPDLGYKNHKRPVTEVTAIKVTKGDFCVRCRVHGHTLKSCRAPFRLICYRCGEKDATARTCWKCSSSMSISPTKSAPKVEVSKKRGQRNRQSGYKYFSANKKCTNPNSKGQQSNVKPRRVIDTLSAFRESERDNEMERRGAFGLQGLSLTKPQYCILKIDDRRASMRAQLENATGIGVEEIVNTVREGVYNKRTPKKNRKLQQQNTQETRAITDRKRYKGQIGKLEAAH